MFLEMFTHGNNLEKIYFKNYSKDTSEIITRIRNKLVDIFGINTEKFYIIEIEDIETDSAVNKFNFRISRNTHSIVFGKISIMPEYPYKILSFERSPYNDYESEEEGNDGTVCLDPEEASVESSSVILKSAIKSSVNNSTITLDRDEYQNKFLANIGHRL